MCPLLAVVSTGRRNTLLGGKRWSVWRAVTRHPTAEWLARQITEAFPWSSNFGASVEECPEEAKHGLILQARLSFTG